MALMTAADVKGMLGITGVAQDAQITALLAPSQASLERMIGLKIEATSYVEDHDGLGRDSIVVDHAPIVNDPAYPVVVKDDLDRIFPAGSVVASTLLAIDYAAGIITIDTSSSLIGWTTFGGSDIFRDGNRNVRVSYKGGYLAANLPADLKLILAEIIGLSLNRIRSAGLQSESIGSYSKTLASGSVESQLSAISRETIAAWRRSAGVI